MAKIIPTSQVDTGFISTTVKFNKPAALYVGTAGDLKISLIDDPATFITYKNVQGFVPLQVLSIHADTTAQDIIALDSVTVT